MKVKDGCIVIVRTLVILVRSGFRRNPVWLSIVETSLSVRIPEVSSISSPLVVLFRGILHCRLDSDINSEMPRRIIDTALQIIWLR